VKERLSHDTPPQRNFMAFGPEALPLSTKVFTMASNTYTPGWLKDVYPGPYTMSQECVRMIGSLLHAPDSQAGFLTPGGTESNLYAVRLARNMAKKARPELVMPETAHYSFNLGAELFGLKVRAAKVDQNNVVDIAQVEKLISKNTAMLVCSAPEPAMGNIDRVEEFAELASKHELYLHVDSCVGGFMLPFLKELGYKIPKFDFSVPEVRSMSADPHKLGMQQKPTSSFIIRDRAYLDAIPVESTFVPYLSGTSRVGASAVSLWALLNHLGRDGYKKHMKHAMDMTKLVTSEVPKIDGLEMRAEPIVPIMGIVSKKHDVRKIVERMVKKGWATTTGVTPVTGVPYIWLYIHPLKTRATMVAYLEDLKKSTREVGS
ncbi:MAG: aminotransferase class V-fold PLP-dependent enzyme, partial [Thaumarchaeota archaeon]|nr:aminotransferase class V-fold PLP-dependent enzyme [Nitrososphaerota archaeon]